MSYIDPRLVLSPKGRVKNLDVIFDGGEGSYSVARMDWDTNPALGIRWNGGISEGLGNPQSRGIATWFILPDEIARTIEQAMFSRSNIT